MFYLKTWFIGPRYFYPVIHSSTLALLSESEIFYLVSCRQQLCSNWLSASISHTIHCEANSAFGDPFGRSLIKICSNLLHCYYSACSLLEVWRPPFQQSIHQLEPIIRCRLRPTFVDNKSLTSYTQPVAYGPHTVCRTFVSYPVIAWLRHSKTSQYKSKYCWFFSTFYESQTRWYWYFIKKVYHHFKLCICTICGI